MKTQTKAQLRAEILELQQQLAKKTKVKKPLPLIDYSTRNYALVEFSSNKKLSKDKSFATLSGSHKTCPETCPFIKTADGVAGCYGDNYGINYHFDAIGTTKGLTVLEVLARLNELTNSKKVRLFDVGDVPNINGIIDIDFIRAINKIVLNRGLKVIQYTHNAMNYENMAIIKGLNYVVNFSTEHLRAAVYGINNGVNTVLVLPSDTPARKVIKHGATSVVTCPAQWIDLKLSEKTITCSDCMLCSKDRVKQRIIVAFYAHGTSAKKIDSAIMAGLK